MSGICRGRASGLGRASYIAGPRDDGDGRIRQEVIKIEQPGRGRTAAQARSGPFGAAASRQFMMDTWPTPQRRRMVLDLKHQDGRAGVSTGCWPRPT